MDGTLSDSETLHFKAYQVVFDRLVPAWSEKNGVSFFFFFPRDMDGTLSVPGSLRSNTYQMVFDRLVLVWSGVCFFFPHLSERSGR